MVVTLAMLINETLKARYTPGRLSYELSSAFCLFTAISPKLGRNYLLDDMAVRMRKVLAESDHACMDSISHKAKNQWAISV